MSKMIGEMTEEEGIKAGWPSEKSTSLTFRFDSGQDGVLFLFNVDHLCNAGAPMIGFVGTVVFAGVGASIVIVFWSRRGGRWFPDHGLGRRHSRFVVRVQE